MKNHSLGKLETSNYIVGPKGGWEFHSRHLNGVLGLIGMVLLTLIGGSVYLYFFHQFQIEELQQRNREEKLKTKKLEETLHQVEERYITQLNLNAGQRGAIIKTISSDIAEEKGALKTELEKKLKDQSELILELEEKNRELTQKISELSQKMLQPEKSVNPPEIQEQLSAASPISIFAENGVLVSIEQFRYGVQGTSLTVQLHLKNLSEDAQSGYISILPIYEKQPAAQASFNSLYSEEFSSIKRFRKFIKKTDFESGHFFKAVRVTVWTRSRSLLLDQYYPIQLPAN